MITYKAELKILSIGVPMILEPNSPIVVQGSIAENLFYLKRGKIKVQGLNINRSTTNQEFFGLYETVTRRPFAFSLTTLTETHLIKIPSKALLDLFDIDAEVRHYLLLQLCKNMEKVEKVFE